MVKQNVQQSMIACAINIGRSYWSFSMHKVGWFPQALRLGLKFSFLFYRRRNWDSEKMKFENQRWSLNRTWAFFCFKLCYCYKFSFGRSCWSKMISMVNWTPAMFHAFWDSLCPLYNFVPTAYLIRLIMMIPSLWVRTQTRRSQVT